MDHVLSIDAAIAAAWFQELQGAVTSHTAGDPETSSLFLFFGNTEAPFLKICLNTGHFLYLVR
jgi:hypothetical protein